MMKKKTMQEQCIKKGQTMSKYELTKEQIEQGFKIVEDYAVVNSYDENGILDGEDYELHHFLVDKNNNEWDLTAFKLDEAIGYSKTLVNCTNCIDCENCKDCEHCIECRDCIGCKDCKGCNSCEHCVNCDWCKECENCYACRSCDTCAECEDCRQLNGCENYIDNESNEQENLRTM